MPELLFLDIETRPGPESLRDEIKSNLAPPATMSKPETIKKWWEEKGEAEVEDRFRSTALSAATARLLCIGYAIDAGDPIVIHGNDREGEEVILGDFFKMMDDLMGKCGCFDIRIVGDNLGFDLKFLYQKACIWGMKPPIMFLREWNKHQWDRCDIGLKWAGSQQLKDRVSLKKIAGALGIPCKTKLEGRQVYDAFMKGGHADIYDYCSEDVRVIREVWGRLF